MNSSLVPSATDFTVPTHLTARAPAKERFVLIDALRGIAALGVLFYHIVNNTVMATVYYGSWPAPLLLLSRLGSYGVSIFFVLSGLVIAHSLRDLPWTPRTVGNFILRRQIRLDPPYWTVLVLTFFLGLLEQRIPGLVASASPSLKNILLNFFYLQEVSGKPFGSLVPVAWTLCIEIQFYLVFLILLTLGRLVARTVKTISVASATTALIVGSGLLSMLVGHFYEDRAWFTSFWLHFAAGVLIYRVKRADASALTFHLYMACFAVATLWAPRNESLALSLVALLVGWATSYLLFFAMQGGQLLRWGRAPLLQYFGSISYSLYLVHTLVYGNLLRVGYKLTGDSPVAAVMWLALAIALSVGLAHLFYLWIEKPSVAYASKWKPHTDTHLAGTPSSPTEPRESSR